MGARTYLPALGMFTATDPVPGGNTTTYTYPQDPINHADYTGTMLSDGPSGSTLNIPLSLPGWKPFNPKQPGKTGTSKTPKGDRRNIPGDNIYQLKPPDHRNYAGQGRSYIWQPVLIIENLSCIPATSDRDAINVMGVVLARGRLSEAQKNHESIHTLQWFLFTMQTGGPPSFAGAYFLAGSNACSNFFEMQAGLSEGGYRC